MKVFILFSVLLFLGGGFRVFCQETSPQIDSLISVLNKTSEKEKHGILIQLSEEYLNYSLDESRKYAQESLELAQKQKDKTKIAISFKKLGIIEYYAGEVNVGLKYFKNALQLFEELKNKKEISNINNNLGLMNSDMGNNQDAIAYFEKSIALDKEMGDNLGVGLSLGNVATVYLNLGDYEKASQLYNEALKIARDEKDPPRIVSNLCNIGLVFHTWGKFTLATDYYLKALKEEEKVGDNKVKAQILLNLGVVYYDWKNYNKALDYYNEALQIQTSMNSNSDVTRTWIDIGVLYDTWGKDDKAMEAYQKALKMGNETQNRKLVATTLFNIASFYEKRKIYKEALKYHEKALQTRIEVEDNYGVASSLNSMGDIYMTMGNSQKALENFKKCEEILKTVSSNELLMNNILNFSDVYYGLGDFKKSRDYLNRYVVIRDSTFTANSQKELANMQTLYETEKKEKEIQLLNIDKEKKNEQMKKQKILIYSFVIGFILILVFSVFLYRLYVQKKKANFLLSEKNTQISQQNEEILSQRDEISAQRDEIEKQRDNAEMQRDQITHQKHEIESSIHYAKRIQTAVLPTKEIINQSVSEYFILFYPRDIVSGDFYWASRKCDQLVVVAADCTGHGVPGAFMSMLGVSFLNEIVNRLAASGTLDSSVILNQLRTQIIRSLHQTGKEGEQKDGMDLSLVILDLMPQTGENKWVRMQYSGANNPIYIVRKSSVESQKLKAESEEENKLSTFNFILDELKPDKMPIGVYENQETSFTKQELMLEPGTQIYLFSDGFADQFGGPKEKKFKYAQLKEKIISYSHESMNVQKELFNKTHLEWKGSLDQTDDVLLIGLKV